MDIKSVTPVQSVCRGFRIRLSFIKKKKKKKKLVVPCIEWMLAMDVRNNTKRRVAEGEAVCWGTVDGCFDFIFYPCHRGGN